MNTQEINRFIIMCVEQYAKSISFDSKTIYQHLNDSGIIKELIDDYEDMHGMSTYSLNEYIRARTNNINALKNESTKATNHVAAKIILISQVVELIAKKA